jgi:uncharacterized lipoprotein NlpE involved in copper resistance
MKTIFILVIVLLAVLSCSTSRGENDGDTGGFQDMLDYHGTYSGILPCADCEGIETELILGNNDIYVRKYSYIGGKCSRIGHQMGLQTKFDNSSPFEETGEYLWDSINSTITLVGVIDSPNMYFFDAGELKQLDMDGREITGKYANKYILKKKLTTLLR